MARFTNDDEQEFRLALRCLIELLQAGRLATEDVSGEAPEEQDHGATVEVRQIERRLVLNPRECDRRCQVPDL